MNMLGPVCSVMRLSFCLRERVELIRFPLLCGGVGMIHGLLEVVCGRELKG